MRREGSPWRGLRRRHPQGAVGPSHQRPHAGARIAGGGDRRRRRLVSLQQIRDVTAEDPFLFLRLFTRSGEPLSFVFVLTLLVPLIAIGLGFDSVNGEHNRRTLSRILSQPIYRDALLFGKFLAGLATLAISLIALWLLVIGLGLVGARRSAERRGNGARVLILLVVTIAYAGVWLALAMLFSIMFRSAATAALVALGLWLFLSILWPLLSRPSGQRLRAVAADHGRRSARRSCDRGRCSCGCRPAPCSTRSWRCCSILGALDPAVAARRHGPGAGRARLDPRCAVAVAAKRADRVAADRRPDRRHDRAVRDRLRRLPAPGSARLASGDTRKQSKGGPIRCGRPFRFSG